jgi:hypothetical protein
MANPAVSPIPRFWLTGGGGTSANTGSANARVRTRRKVNINDFLLIRSIPPSMYVQEF